MLEWKKDGWKGALALAPMLILLLVFTFYPIFNTVMISFFPNYNYITYEFGKFGFDSYKTVLTDSKFWSALGMTALMVVASVPLSIFISLLISVALCSIKKLQGIFQTIFFLPYVTNGVAFGMVFATIFAPTPSGLINTMLNTVVSWTGSTNTVPIWAGILVITVYSVWNGLAFKILVFIGGIQGIDKQYYQAAQIDGASKGRVFRKITLPLLSPMVLYITITSLIGAFKAYSSVVSLYGETMGNGSDGTFMTAVGYIYSKFNSVTNDNLWYLLSESAAAAVVLFIFILIVTMGQLAYNKRRVHY